MEDAKAILDYIEDEPIELSKDYYYHAFCYEQKSFINMISEGIKSPILLGKSAQGYNGPFYVSLSKKENCEMSIYNILKDHIMFIIDGKIKTIKTRNFRRYGEYPISCTSTFLPFRVSGYDDEYQKFLKVSPEHILGIKYNLLTDCERNAIQLKKELLTLKAMINDLKNQKIDLPIIDASASRRLNKEKILALKI